MHFYVSILPILYICGINVIYFLITEETVCGIRLSAMKLGFHWTHFSYFIFINIIPSPRV